MNAFYLAIAVVVITGLTHSLLGNVIKMVRDTATNNPNGLRNTTPQEALAKADSWEKSRKKLWPLAAVVAGGLVLFGIVFQ